MSDFDKEAEREKLRKKFEKEEEKRKTTEQMSELLLKGATMTNAHCSDCGDPIFRYDGQEFCPTCQKPITRESADESADDSEDRGDHIEVAAPSDEARVQFGRQQSDGETNESAESDQGQPASESADPANRSSPHETGGEAASNGSIDEQAVNSDATAPDSARSIDTSSQSTSQNPPVSPRTPDAAGEPSDVQADLAEAERLLAHTVKQFAERAASTDDPRRAKAHLEAAREAAETLDAVSF